jgi:DNA-binding NarL/FixJ family response regulator
MALRCVIVDDSVRFIAAARDVLEREGVEVVGTATSSAEGRQRVDDLRPDVVLVDIVLGDESGFDFVRELANGSPGAPATILLSTHSERDFADLIVASPARGFLAKSELSARAVEDLLD